MHPLQFVVLILTLSCFAIRETTHIQRGAAGEGARVNLQGLTPSPPWTRGGKNIVKRDTAKSFSGKAPPFLAENAPATTAHVNPTQTKAGPERGERTFSKFWCRTPKLRFAGACGLCKIVVT